jgi:hypothetical protein
MVNVVGKSACRARSTSKKKIRALNELQKNHMMIRAIFLCNINTMRVNKNSIDATISMRETTWNICLTSCIWLFSAEVNTGSNEDFHWMKAYTFWTYFMDWPDNVLSFCTTFWV